MTIKEIEALYVEKDPLPQVFHPWRRYLARMFDLSLYGVLWLVFLSFVFNINLTSRSGLVSFFDSLMILLIMLFLEPLWLHLLSTTPGKAILGLFIKAHDGRNLSYGEGLERTWSVIGKGMGYNIPIYSLYRFWKSYKICSDSETQPWDEETSYTIRDTKWYRTVLYLAANAALIFALFTLHSAKQLPPNRGDLTVAEFVENHNYYADFLGINLGNEYLDKNGEWAEKEFDGFAYIDIGYAKKPEYSFTLENGCVNEISFSVEVINSDDWISSYDTYMILASFAFSDVQGEMRLFSKVPSLIAKNINNNSFRDFSFSEAGINFTCDYEYSGYNNPYGRTDFLFHAEGASETYFRMNFSMCRQE